MPNKHLAPNQCEAVTTGPTPKRCARGGEYRHAGRLLCEGHLKVALFDAHLAHHPECRVWTRTKPGLTLV